MALIRKIFIDDNYLELNYPLPINIERKNILPSIKFAQYTKLRDFLGACLYEHLEDGYINQTLTSDEETLMGMLQYLLGFYTAIDMVDFIRVDNSLAKTGFDIDDIMQSNFEKADVMERNCSNFIVSKDAIYDIGTADDCTSKFYPHDGGAASGIYYPYDYSVTNCEEGFWKFYPAT